MYWCMYYVMCPVIIESSSIFTMYWCMYYVMCPVIIESYYPCFMYGVCTMLCIPSSLSRLPYFMYWCMYYVMYPVIMCTMYCLSICSCSPSSYVLCTMYPVIIDVRLPSCVLCTGVCTMLCIPSSCVLCTVCPYVHVPRHRMYHVLCPVHHRYVRLPSCVLCTGVCTMLCIPSSSSRLPYFTYGVCTMLCIPSSSSRLPYFTYVVCTMLCIPSSCVLCTVCPYVHVPRHRMYYAQCVYYVMYPLVIESSSIFHVLVYVLCYVSLHHVYYVLSVHMFMYPVIVCTMLLYPVHHRYVRLPSCVTYVVCTMLCIPSSLSLSVHMFMYPVIVCTMLLCPVLSLMYVFHRVYYAQVYVLCDVSRHRRVVFHISCPGVCTMLCIPSSCVLCTVCPYVHVPRHRMYYVTVSRTIIDVRLPSCVLCTGVCTMLCIPSSSSRLPYLLYGVCTMLCIPSSCVLCTVCPYVHIPRHRMYYVTVSRTIIDVRLPSCVLYTGVCTMLYIPSSLSRLCTVFTMLCTPSSYVLCYCIPYYH